MPQAPFPMPGSDSAEPYRSSSAFAAGDGPDAWGPGPQDDWDGDDVFVCLPPEEADLAGFADGGAAKAMGPGPVLASLVHGAVGPEGKRLARLSEDELFGVLAAARRLESRAAWTQMAVIREFAARRAAGPAAQAQFAADELADELHLTWQSAAGQMAYACAVAERLPQTFAALAAGKIHPVHVRIIDDETRVLSDTDAAAADEALAQAAQSKTWAQLRSAAHRLVLKLDPDAARRRKEAGRRQAHVRRFREQSGNGGMTARELPADEVLASWQHVEQRALDLRAAGMPGSLRELRVRAYLDLLQERDSRTAASNPGSETGSEPGSPQDKDNGHGEDGVSGPGRPVGDSAQTTQEGSADPDAGPDGGTDADAGPVDSDADRQPRGTGPSIAALVTITAPLATALGQSGSPGEVSGFGLVDAGTVRDLVAAAARNPATRWCLTALHPDGTAAAHGCARGRHSPPAAGSTAAEFLADLKVRLHPVIRGPCDHEQAEDGYRPSRALAHLVRARSARCTAPGCRQPAEKCDLDHTTAWDSGGRTCPCCLAPLCRHHHRCKQAEGWRLEQPEPGVLVWRTPSGRTYTTTPTVYHA